MGEAWCRLGLDGEGMGQAGIMWGRRDAGCDKMGNVYLAG